MQRPRGGKSTAWSIRSRSPGRTHEHADRDGASRSATRSGWRSANRSATPLGLVLGVTVGEPLGLALGDAFVLPGARGLVAPGTAAALVPCARMGLTRPDRALGDGRAPGVVAPPRSS